MTAVPRATPYRPTVDKVGASEILGCAPRTLDNWRSQGRGPKFIRVGRLCRYKIEDLEKYLAARTVETDCR